MKAYAGSLFPWIPLKPLLYIIIFNVCTDVSEYNLFTELKMFLKRDGGVSYQPTDVRKLLKSPSHTIYAVFLDACKNKNP